MNSTTSARQLSVQCWDNTHRHDRFSNGYHGWSEHTPFNKVIVTAAPDLIPPPLIHQLKAGGKLVIPAGLTDAQTLILVEKQRRGNDHRDSASTVSAT
jgi:protein-L-isoaspartate O-methyltransferase